MRKSTLVFMSLVGSFVGTLLANVVINGQETVVVQSVKRVGESIGGGIKDIIQSVKKKK